MKEGEVKKKLMTATRPVCAFSQGREVIHEDLLGHFSLSQLYHCVWRAEHRPTLTNTQQTRLLYESYWRAQANQWCFISPITVSEEVRRSLICLRMSWYGSFYSQRTLWSGKLRTAGMAFGSSNMFSYLKHQTAGFISASECQSDGFVELLFRKYHVERNACQRLIWQVSYMLLLPVLL